MKLHVETAGQGPDVVLLHGWGLHHGVWNELTHALAPRFRVHAMDLPGYGASAACERGTLDALAQHVAQTAPQRCVVGGWSLGGQVALTWARVAPRQVTRLALIATSPCFAQRDDWPHAVAVAVLREFERALTADCDGTLKRFLALLAQGDVRAGQVKRRLRDILFARSRPALRTLRQGLALLLGTDLRGQLHAITQPALVVHGDCDALTPLAAGEHLSRALPNARLAVMRETAHVPFISDAERAAVLLTDFFDGR